MSDLFHKSIPREFVSRVFDTMEEAHWHTFQVLTKRSSLMRDFLVRRYRSAPCPAHVWFGVSVEDHTKTSRVRHLQNSPARIRFISVEPLVGRIGTLNLENIDWVIVGGESGPSARAMKPEWVQEVRDQCIASGVAFFFKQWGGYRPKSGGRELDGIEWNQFPMRPAPYSVAAE